jgi:hypothetical protein
MARPRAKARAFFGSSLDPMPPSEYPNKIMYFIDLFPLRTQRDMRKMSLKELKQVWLMSR